MIFTIYREGERGRYLVPHGDREVEARDMESAMQTAKSLNPGKMLEIDLVEREPTDG